MVTDFRNPQPASNHSSESEASTVPTLVPLMEFSSTANAWSFTTGGRFDVETGVEKESTATPYGVGRSADGGGSVSCCSLYWS